MNTLKYFIVTLFLVSLSWSCTQEEGFGGNSNINGVLVERYYNEDFSILQYETPAKDEDVFILFGDEINMGENTATSYTGNFQFEYLWPGDYKLYYYSKDSTSTLDEKTALVSEITLEKNQTKGLDTLYTCNTLKWNEGTAKIRGKIFLINYKTDLSIKDITPAQEQDVYINYNNADFFTDKIETQGDGTFEFSNLLKGTYTIFVYSEDVITGSTANIIKEFEIEITETNQLVNIEDIIIEKI